MINKIRGLLKGKKVYITGVIMIILGCLQDFNQELIFGGILALTGRAAISKVKVAE